MKARLSNIRGNAFKRCPKCGRPCQDISALHQHMKAIHPPAPEDRLDFCDEPGCGEFAQTADSTCANTLKFKCVRHEREARASGQSGRRQKVESDETFMPESLPETPGPQQPGWSTAVNRARDLEAGMRMGGGKGRPAKKEPVERAGPVFELAPGGRLLRHWPGVPSAAEALGVDRAVLEGAIRRGELLAGKRYSHQGPADAGPVTTEVSCPVAAPHQPAPHFQPASIAASPLPSSKSSPQTPAPTTGCDGSGMDAPPLSGGAGPMPAEAATAAPPATKTPLPTPVPASMVTSEDSIAAGASSAPLKSSTPRRNLNAPAAKRHSVAMQFGPFSRKESRMKAVELSAKGSDAVRTENSVRAAADFLGVDKKTLIAALATRGECKGYRVRYAAAEAKGLDRSDVLDLKPETSAARRPSAALVAAEDPITATIAQLQAEVVEIQAVIAGLERAQRRRTA